VTERLDRSLVTALLGHYDAHRRDLPWREGADPYAVWVSEIMLQQTRVETARPYYERWLERFPDLDALADAEMDDVLRAWQGLGYYTRARNLHRAARMVRERYSGVVPSDPAELRRLPGVGEYTAGAVASIAFGVPTPAVDGNVRRVLARLHDLEDPTPAQLHRLAAELVPADRPGDFNQAMMELGATVCTPRAPDCDACPVARCCRARERGVQEARPRRARRAPVPRETVETSVIVRGDGAFLLTRRPPRGLLAGLWEFPDETAPAWVAELRGRALSATALEPVSHTFSHKQIKYRPMLYLLDADPVPGADDVSGRDDGAPPSAAWAHPRRLTDYALPVAQQKIASAARAALSGTSLRPPRSPRSPR
jgi:A/G-specific adenine glycosylase